MSSVRLRFAVGRPIWFLPVCILGVLCWGNLSYAHSGSPQTISNPQVSRSSESREMMIRSVTDQMLKMAATPGNTARLAALARYRGELMAGMMADDPTSALRHALGSTDLAGLPEEAAAFVERKATVSGKLELIHEDDFNRKVSREEYQLKTADGRRLRVQVGKNSANLTPDSSVVVTGLQLGEQFVIADGSDRNTVQVMAEPMATTSDKKVAVIAFNFQNNPSQSFSLNEIRKTVFTNLISVRNYYLENSLNRISFESQVRSDGDVFGNFTIPYNDTDACSYSNWTSAARKAAEASGVDLSGYTNIVYISGTHPELCKFDGVAAISGNWSYIAGYLNVTLISHELGHNFGSHHASSITCFDQTGRQVSLSDNCQQDEYGDPFDTMGDGDAYHMNNFNKGRTGVLTAGNTQTVTTDGTYELLPVESVTTGVVALRVPRTTNLQGRVTSYFYLEYRRPTPFDNFAPKTPVVNGVTIRIAPDYGTVIQTQLIDTTPETDTFIDAPLLAGRTFREPAKGITIKTLSAGSTKAVVQISAGCKPSRPGLTVTPSYQTGRAGQTLYYQFTVTNNDSAGCSPSYMSAAPALPVGWTQSVAPVRELAPGASSTWTVGITAPTSAPLGEQTLTWTAENPVSRLKATASAVYAVASYVPHVKITSPRNGAWLFSSKVTVSASATALSGMNRIDLFVDDTKVGTCSRTTSCTVTASMIGRGIHTITAKAYALDGNYSLESITVRRVL